MIMNEKQESIIRSRAILLLNRNHNKNNRIMERFLKCITGGSYSEAKKIINKA